MTQSSRDIVCSSVGTALIDFIATLNLYAMVPERGLGMGREKQSRRTIGCLLSA